MTPLELADSAVRSAVSLPPLAGRSVTVIGPTREAARCVTTLQAVGADGRVEPVETRVDLTADALIVVTVESGLRARAVVAAREAGVPILGDLDVAWLASGSEAFAVTGGARAGHAALLTAALLAAHDRSVIVLGDQTTGPACEADVMVVEPSLDQLSAIQVFRPRLAVIMRGAAPASVRLMSHQMACDCLVLTDDADLRSLARMSRAPVVWLSTEHPLDHGVYVADDRIAARLNGHVEQICPVAGMPAPELEATLAAVACGLWAGLDPARIGELLVRRSAVDRQRPDRARTPEGAVLSSPSLTGARTLAARARAMLSVVAGSVW